MASISRLDVYPVKSLNGVSVDCVPIAEGGRIAYDREYAIFDSSGDYVNGKNNDQVYKLESDIDVESRTISLRNPAGDFEEFHLEDDREALTQWLTEYFEQEVDLARAEDRNFNDSSGGMAPMRISAPGPTIISRGTLDEVASWFDEFTAHSIRRRLRTNIEIDGVDPFWEDHLFADQDHVMEFKIGDVTLYGIMPKPRCRVPAMDPDTGERHSEFIKVFTEKREENFPDWADSDHLGQHINLDVEHYYYLTVVTRIPRTEIGKTLNVDDEVEIVETKPTYKIL